ncbi:tyrosine-type recombinase/integrase [Arthrobacter sulfonylureivorans]|uniref:tyrosine-type recombinase/integrase n=1 Tax=Arthrobacter sulfonylureivorans TaxID=2486855 RepID=UPI0039E4A09F
MDPISSRTHGRRGYRGRARPAAAGPGTAPRARDITVGALYADWMRLLTTQGLRGRPIAASTAANYRKNWHRHIAPRWSSTPVDQVHWRDVGEWIAGLQAGSRGQSGNNTRRRVALMFIRLMRHSVYLELLPENPATDATGRAGYVPRAPVEKRRIYLSMPELQDLAGHCAPWTDLIMLAGTTGLRWGEITALHARDFRSTPDGWLLEVLRSWKEGDAGAPSPNTKNGGTRTVPVPDKVAAMVLGARPAEGLLFRSPGRGGVPGGRLHHSNFAARVLRPAAAGAGLDPAPTFHDLRHTAVSLILHSTKDVKLAQRIAGHSSAQLTLDTYAELFEQTLFTASRALDGLIE